MTISARTYHLGRGSALVPIDLKLAIGQRVIQERNYEEGVICEKRENGYTVIFPDGDEAQSQQLDCLSPFTRIKLVDGPLATESEVSELLALRDWKRIKDREDRDAAERAKKAEEARIVEELRVKYPWAEPDGKVWGSTRAAKNLRKELRLTFPGVKFSVTSDRFSGGDSVSIRWTLGPSGEEVRKITDKYESGTFDAMTDCGGYDHSAYGNAVEAILGRARFVSESREVPSDIEEQIARGLCALQHVEYVGPYTRHLCGEGDTYDIRDHVNQLLAQTSFGAKAVYAGVEYTPTDEQDGRNWCRVRFE